MRTSRVEELMTLDKLCSTILFGMWSPYLESAMMRTGGWSMSVQPWYSGEAVVRLAVCWGQCWLGWPSADTWPRHLISWAEDGPRHPLASSSLSSPPPHSEVLRSWPGPCQGKHRDTAIRYAIYGGHFILSNRKRSIVHRCDTIYVLQRKSLKISWSDIHLKAL